MISSISGTVKSTSISSIVVEVGGVGVLLQVPIRIAAKIQSGEMVSFHTYLIVREDALTLYGFFFQLLELALRWLNQFWQIVMRAQSQMLLCHQI